MASLEPKYDFQEIQLAWAAHMRDPIDKPAPADIEARRLLIYRDLIFNNIESFLISGFPILYSLVSDDDWQWLVRDFIIKHECHSPYFLEISQEFLGYLNEQQPDILSAMPFALELAHYEWVELALDVSTESFPPGTTPAGDLLDDPLVLSPLAWRLSYHYPVHKIGPDYQPQLPPDQPSYLIVYRNREEQVRFLESNAVTIRLLQLLESGGQRARQALIQIAKEIKHQDADFIVAAGLDTLKQLKELSIVCGFRA